MPTKKVLINSIAQGAQRRDRQSKKGDSGPKVSPNVDTVSCGDSEDENPHDNNNHKSNKNNSKMIAGSSNNSGNANTSFSQLMEELGSTRVIIGGHNASSNVVRNNKSRNNNKSRDNSHDNNNSNYGNNINSSNNNMMMMMGDSSNNNNGSFNTNDSSSSDSETTERTLRKDSKRNNKSQMTNEKHQDAAEDQSNNNNQAPTLHERFIQENIVKLLKGIEVRSSESSPAHRPQKIPDDLRTAVHAAFLAITQPKTASDKWRDFMANDQQNNSSNENEYKVVADHLLEIISPLLTPANNENHNSYVKNAHVDVEKVVSLEFTRMRTCYSDDCAAMSIMHLESFVKANLDFIAELLRANKVDETFLEYAKRNQFNNRNECLKRLRQPIMHRPRSSEGNDASMDDFRMIDSGSWVDVGDMLDHRSVPDSNATSVYALFASSNVQIIGGASGSGKTSCAITGLGPDSIVVYCTITDNSAGFDDPKNTRLATADATSNYCSAAKYLMKLVTHVVTGREESFDQKQPEYIDNFSFGTQWTVFPRGFKIHVVLDEVGGNPKFCHQACGVWRSTCRTWLADEKRFNCQVDQLYLTLVGTGIENFEQARGSQPDTYEIFTVNPSRLFFRLLQHLRDDNSAKDDPTLPKMTQVAEVVISHLYIGDGTPVPQDLVEHRFLQLVTSNARCAALAIDEFRHLVRGINSFITVDLSFVLGNLPTICVNIMNRFANLNGLQKYAKKVSDFSTPVRNRLRSTARLQFPNATIDREAEADVWRSQMLAGALRCAILKPSLVPDQFWRDHAVDLGLITDTARSFSEQAFEEQKNHLTVVVQATQQQKNQEDDPPLLASKKQSHVLAFRLGGPRFEVPEAVVAMYLLRLGRSGIPSGRGDFRTGGWKLFESSIADFVELCCRLRIKQPPTADRCYFTTVVNQRRLSIMYPIAIFCPPQPQTEHFATFRIVHLHKPFGEATVSDPWYEEQKKVWKSMLSTGKPPDHPQQQQDQQQQGSGVIIFENVGNTAFADVVVLFPGRILLIQCKYYYDSSLNATQADAAFNTHESCENALSFLIDCCQKNKEKVEIFSVLAGAHEDSFFKTVGGVLNKSSSLPEALVKKAVLSRFATVAFHSKSIATQQASHLYPIMQFHLVNRGVDRSVAPKTMDVTMMGIAEPTPTYKFECEEMAQQQQQQKKKKK